MDVPRRDRAEIAISVAIVALALFVFSELSSIPAEGGYSAVGPRFAPMIVGIGLLAIGVLLMRQALTGGWRDRVPRPTTCAPAAVDRRRAGPDGHRRVRRLRVAPSLLIEPSPAWVIPMSAFDALMIAWVFVFCTRVLGLSLPASPLGIV
jgi:hypothetical protein